MNSLITVLVILSMINGENQNQNRLTSGEEQEGWVLLFDGRTTNGWRNYGKDHIGSAWKAVDGSLVFDPAGGDGGDVITVEEFENFQLSLEWKISPCGNSGIMFNVVEDQKYHSPWLTGPEMQILDNTCHPDAKIHTHRAGDLYDLIACSSEPVKPAGEWNQVRIISNAGKYEFWLNGTRVVSFTMHTPEWNQLVEKSKFKEFPDFGKARKGHLALQDHGDKVWFRNIKIKTL
jgi:hypothetical protein